VTAIFEKYYLDEQSPRVHPPEEADAWFQREIVTGQIDGVIFYVPLSDDVAGWSYPRWMTAVNKKRIPSVLIRTYGPSEELSMQLEDFLRRCAED
jgi:hypothetical protein